MQPGSGRLTGGSAAVCPLAANYWLSTVEDSLTPRPALPGDLDVDVAIVGAGYAGLWTAYYLACADPGLRIAVLEAEFAGYGASGRNGGWCSALFPRSIASLARAVGRDRAVALHRALRSTVDEVGRVAAAERIDCHNAKGGTVVVARTPAQLTREPLPWLAINAGLQLVRAADAMQAHRRWFAG